MTRTCKYCGKEFPENTKHKSRMCGVCAAKSTLIPRFAIERDKLRVKCGLKPLEQSTSDENTCSIVD